jgi:pantoate--beta-alanine ligase
VDIVFSPGTKDIYPHGFRTYVDVQGLSQVLCGKSRPGHFRAVATIVAKLFNIVQPDTAYFGQKDAQQALIIRRMVKDLNMPVEIRILPTVREKNGLAMSSRNIYLSPKQRLMAPVLYKALKMASRLIRQGNRNYQSVIEKVRRFIQSQSNAQIDYISIVDLDNLAVFRRSSGKCLIALAVRIGKTRLIDNLTVKIK